MAMYESEHTKFMREWMAKHAEERGVQKKGRALWWDKPQETQTTREFAEARLPSKAYPYATES